jgi:hypothetical protein
MLTKEKVKELVDHMPESFQANELINEIMLLQKIEDAQDQAKRGETLTEDEFDNEVDSWQ